MRKTLVLDAPDREGSQLVTRALVRHQTEVELNDGFVRCGSKAEVQPRSRDVRCWGKSGSRFAVWKRVVKAVEKLLSKERPDGATVQ